MDLSDVSSSPNRVCGFFGIRHLRLAKRKAKKVSQSVHSKKHKRQNNQKDKAINQIKRNKSEYISLGDQ
jgi:hypothetical protein